MTTTPRHRVTLADGLARISESAGKRGSGTFLNGAARHPFGPGDFLFVPAGVVHRFEDFPADPVVWVVFYGPEGGER